jgi:hypothetical protein
VRSMLTGTCVTVEESCVFQTLAVRKMPLTVSNQPLVRAVTSLYQCHPLLSRRCVKFDKNHFLIGTCSWDCASSRGT